MAEVNRCQDAVLLKNKEKIEYCKKICEREVKSRKKLSPDQFLRSLK
ncbi:MAG: hypothetical protein QXW35_05065 [Candidatus Aenigmatarchaeota archaeon]